MTSALEAWQAEVGALLISRSRQAAATFRLLSRAMDVLALLLPGDAELAELWRLRALAEKHFVDAASTDPKQPAFEAAVARAESVCNQLETRFVALDGEVPMDWFKDRFDARLLTPESIVDYAAALGRHLEDLPQRLDRIEYALTQMVAVALAEGARAPARDLEALFRDAFPAAAIDDSTRQAAVAFFAQAAQRVAGFTRLKELFDSGVFVDVRGYKLSLRGNLLDPDIVAAAIDANRAITEKVNQLLAADAPSEKEVRQHFDEVNAQIRAIFTTLRADESELKVRFEQRLKKLQLTGAPPPRTFEQFVARRSQATAMKPGAKRRLVLGALLLVFGGALVWRFTRGTDMEALTPQELRALSPVLASGSRSRGAEGVLLGRVDRARWTLLSPEQRREAAGKLAAQLAARQLRAATVLLDDRVVVSIQDGKVLLVE